MFTETNTFLDESGQDLTRALWTMPNGDQVLVSQGNDGFHLYHQTEWNNALVSSYRADREGHVRLHDRYVDYHDPAWVVPQEIRERAIR